MDKNNYPISLAESESDPRFTAGLIFEVIDVLERHGYPSPVGADYAEVHCGLFRLLYRSAG
ncbi:hypothetical protein ACFFQW_34315 [Umezawaea endophytica]|uniref:Uncharacterized protein n=1 Tax=Umezawaea endophytica TaxID=1654476 RepID=A0A9X2VWV6_9PSEU|nr:hypothetical protein [Umezawaea endophytica]MCS7484405.1 hypothetical protein [Umezawaea endophytica]